MIYYFTLSGLTAVNMNDRICSILHGTKDEQEYYSATDDYKYSADTYGNNKTGTLLDVCKALFAYSDSAKSYFAG